MSSTKDGNVSAEKVANETDGKESISGTDASPNTETTEQSDNKESSPDIARNDESDEDEANGEENSGEDGEAEEDTEEEDEETDGEKEKSDETSKNKIKAKPKKPVLVNVFMQCTSKDLLESQSCLEELMQENEVNIKELSLSTELSWVRLGQLELEKTDDREKALALCGKHINGKEIRIERVRDNANDRLYAPDDCILFIRNLSKTATEEQLRNLYPKAKEVRLPKKNGKNRGFAFINFASKKEVEELIKDRQSEELDGKTLKLGTYTSKDKLESRKQYSRGNSLKKSPASKQAGSSGKSGGGNRSSVGRPHNIGYYGRQYPGGRYPNQIRSLLDIDTSGFGSYGHYQGEPLRSLIDEYGFYNGEFGMDSYLYDLHSRMGLESGLAKRMGYGYPGQYGLDRRFGGMGDSAGVGYGRVDRRQMAVDSRTSGYSGYGNHGPYNDGIIVSYRNSERKRNRSGGNRTVKGKSGWPAK